MIQTEPTPNPESLKFLSENTISAIGTEEFQKNNIGKATNPFIKELLGFKGVELVLFSKNFLSVKKTKEVSWNELKPMVISHLNHYFENNKEPILKEELKILRNKNLEISSKEAELTLEKYHPDFSEIRESDEFHQWADKQPEEIKGWIYSNGSNATLAARAIDLFKQDVGKLKSTNNQELSGDLVSSSEMIKVKNNKEIGYGSKKMYTRSQIAAMSQSEFDKNEQAITQAMSEGRVINDMDRSYGGSGNPNY